ncbi:hypothetical protein CRUP_018097 [Coryphaenoides rupestris]|nr:hypothetical protein CRUP_018097 [Coryphaenoides rupestris]
MAASWVQRVASFLRSPSRLLSGTTAEGLLGELLRELRDDRLPYDVKYPSLLCPSACAGEETSLELMSVFSHCPPKHTEFRCQLLVAIATVLVGASRLRARSHASRDFVELLLQLAQDTYYDPQADAALSIRATACECLRELEACCPGLLSQHLELLNTLRQQENSRHHQALSGLYTMALRNAVHLLAQQAAAASTGGGGGGGGAGAGAGAESLKALLAGNAVVAWEAEPDSSAAEPLPSVLVPVGGVGVVPTLQTGPECKELRSILSSLLEESYLLTPLAQAALLHGLIEVVAMVCLFHCTLLMKAAFTDSLFSGEDEAFVLKRLVALCQHPRLSASDKLFYTACLLHFPENRPIGGGGEEEDGEALPVLLTPKLAAALLPTAFNDTASMLARFNLASLVYLEEGGEEEEEEEEEEESVRGRGGGGGGLAYLYDHLGLLLRAVERGGGRECAVTFFRACFLFLRHFSRAERYAADLRRRLCALYLSHARLAPHILNLADRAQGHGAVEPRWAVELLRSLQGVVVTAGVPQGSISRSPDLHWHLRVLARVAEEGEINQASTLDFLFTVTTTASFSVSEDWRLGSDTLAVCRRLLVHPGLDALLCPLADVLQHMATSDRHHGDTDVRDHARLYYTLLTTLSREKLSGMLAPSGSEGDNNKEGRQDKKRSMSSIMVESQRLASTLTIHHAPVPIFQLVPLERGSQPCIMDEPIATECEDDPSAGSTVPVGPDTGQDDVLSSYRSQLRGSSSASQVALHYELSYVDPAPDPNPAPGPTFDQLFSIRLHFEPTDGHYGDLPDVCVPCLFRERTPPPSVMLTLRPRAPYPTTLCCSAVFTSQDELTWHAALPDMCVAFHQLFKPLPIPSSSSSKLRVFEALWEEFCAEEIGDGDEAENPTPDRASSLFCWQVGEAALEGLVEEHFAPYRVSKDPQDEDEVEEEEEGEGETHRVLIFLPPHYHVLLKICPGEDAARFNMATDNWRLLPHINSFLLSITGTDSEQSNNSATTR